MTQATNELTGQWAVHRSGGLLPPLIAVRKRVEGDRGWTTVFGVKAAPFDVVGLELRYRPPFSAFVDVMTPESASSYTDRATFRGRTFGTFRMRRVG